MSVSDIRDVFVKGGVGEGRDEDKEEGEADAERGYREASVWKGVGVK